FGSTTATRTTTDKFAFIKFGDALIPCKLEYLFRLTVEKKELQLCAVVAQMVVDERVPAMPWDEYALELGTFTAYADRFSDFQVVKIEQVLAPMALCKLKAQA
ncbi:hypothetical protein FRC06_009312, partial [Ceratobasidium sp. 370]